MRFLSALMPREARFFALFNQHAELVAAAAIAALAYWAGRVVL